MKVTVVYNPNAGGALARRHLAAMFKKSKITVTNWIKLGAINQKDVHLHGIVAVVGGDGTISQLASKLAGTKTELAPLPGGTLNHFTKDLGIPQDINEAIARLARAKMHTIDIASVNGEYFVNNSSLGIYPSSLSLREKLERKIGKWPAMVAASFRALVRFRTYTLTIGKETFTTPFVFIGNNRYEVDAFGVAQRNSLTSGIVSVFIAKTASRLVLLKIAILTLVGRGHLLEEFDVREARSVTIRSRHAGLSVSRDGEIGRTITPLEYKIHPKYLRVRC